MHWFYCTDIHQRSAVLDKVESNHCIRSLRHKVGDEVILCDGRGSIYEARITSANSNKCELQIISQKDSDPPKYQLHVAIAPTKQNERFEWFLEKAMEIGISEISPILCNNSERRKIKPERYQKVLVTALKQSHHPYLPQLNELRSIDAILKQETTAKRFIAHCRSKDLPLLKDQIKVGEDCLVLVGPEGDFTEEEVNNAVVAGFRPISLGRSRLRTETAGIVAVQTLAFVNS